MSGILWGFSFFAQFEKQNPKRKRVTWNTDRLFPTSRPRWCPATLRGRLRQPQTKHLVFVKKKKNDSLTSLSPDIPNHSPVAALAPFQRESESYVHELTRFSDLGSCWIRTIERSNASAQEKSEELSPFFLSSASLQKCLTSDGPIKSRAHTHMLPPDKQLSLCCLLSFCESAALF